MGQQEFGETMKALGNAKQQARTPSPLSFKPLAAARVTTLQKHHLLCVGSTIRRLLAVEAATEWQSTLHL